MADGGLSEQEQAEMLRKKYGGIIPKKKGLLSKGNERAYFDSAEYAMHKQKGQVEVGKVPEPKLEPDPEPPAHHRKSLLADTPPGQ